MANNDRFTQPYSTPDYAKEQSDYLNKVKNSQAQEENNKKLFGKGTQQASALDQSHIDEANKIASARDQADADTANEIQRREGYEKENAVGVQNYNRYKENR